VPIMSTMKRKNIHLTEWQIEVLQILAKRTGLSMADLIRRAIDEYVRKEQWNSFLRGEKE